MILVAKAQGQVIHRKPVDRVEIAWLAPGVSIKSTSDGRGTVGCRRRPSCHVDSRAEDLADSGSSCAPNGKRGGGAIIP